MRLLTTTLLALLLAPIAQAQDDAEEAPEFLMNDLGIRVDLPNGWQMMRWSDWDFKAETTDPVFLEVWTSEEHVQSDVSRFDADVWMDTFTAKLGEATEVKLDASKVEEIQGQQVALLDISGTLGSGSKVSLKGATLAVQGQMVHMSFIALSRFDKKLDSKRHDIVDRLEIHQGAEDVKFAPTLEGNGFTHTLPDGWREPIKGEMGTVNKQIASLGLEKLDGCWLAMQPRALAKPDAMVSCQGGKLLGVVDEYSFEGVEEEVRKVMFGGADVAPARRLDLEDRVAFVYDLPDKGLAVGVVPFDKGIVRTWAVGSGEDAALGEALEATLRSSTYSGEHPAGLGDMFSYYVSYRPFSPMVLCPALSLLVLGGGLIVGGGLLMGRRKNKYEALLDD